MATITRTVHDIGDTVVCDICNVDYTDSGAVGGFLLQSKGICPGCAPRMDADLKKYGEEQYVRARANEGETFRAFILRMRGGDNTVTITSFEPDR